MRYFIDFEFTSSNELDVDVVCAVVKPEHSDSIRFWLHRNEAAKAEFRTFLSKLEGHVLVSYAAMAECRALRSLGIDPLRYQWIDLYVEWRQLKNHNNKFNFGWVKDDLGNVVLSKPHHTHHECHRVTGYSLSSCALRLLKEDVDAKTKEVMRALILSRGGTTDSFSNEEMSQVTEYCARDVEGLPRILEKMTRFYHRHFEENRESVMQQRGRYIAALSGCEHFGTPIDLEALEKISANYCEIVRGIYLSMNEVFPLYEERKDGVFAFKLARFAQLLKELKLLRDWPKTKNGNPSIESKVLQKYRHRFQIEKVHQTRKAISSMRSLKRESGDKLRDRIGSDGNVRSYFGPFGTQTGRNAAKASNFIFAMSNWLRVLIRPPKGKAISVIDYSSQEFAIAASLSRDEGMRRAYLSGDPYFYFAKQAGAVPKEGTKEQYTKERELFKATTLGLQYGMGYASLAEKLTQDIGREVAEEEAQRLIEWHQQFYPSFWNWTEACSLKYSRAGALETNDGWVLFGDNPSSLSVKNFLVQATGASIMRRAVILAAEADLTLVAPLHDAIYIIHDENDTGAIEKLRECMLRASAEFIDIEIRTSANTYRSDHPWVEDKGRADYERFRKYLEHAG